MVTAIWRLLSLLLLLSLGLDQAAAAQSITLEWNASAETNVTRYRLYYGLGPREYLTYREVFAPATSATTGDLQPGQKYHFAVTAVNVHGLESGYSSEVIYTVPDGPDLTELLVVTGHPPVGLLAGDTEEIIQIGSEPDATEEPIFVDASSGPRLEILPVGQPAVAYFLSFEAPPNSVCELQVSGDLMGWRRLVPFTAGTASKRFAFTDLAGPEPRRYYRLMIR